MRELNALAETLRASIASLDEQIERRARVLASELAAAGEPAAPDEPAPSGITRKAETTPSPPATSEEFDQRVEQIGELLHEGMERLLLAGRLIRDSLAAEVPDAARAIQSISEEGWTVTALSWGADLHPAGAEIAARLKWLASRPERIGEA